MIPLVPNILNSNEVLKHHLNKIYQRQVANSQNYDKDLWVHLSLVEYTLVQF